MRCMQRNSVRTRALCIFSVFLVSLLSLSFEAQAQNNSQECDNSAWYKYPLNGRTYEAGSSIYVEIDAADPDSIDEIKLYINEDYIDDEERAPYEWGRPNSNSDRELRNLAPGEYTLRARVEDECGDEYDLYTKFYIAQPEGGNAPPPSGGCNTNAEFDEPGEISSISAGDDLYVRVDPERRRDVDYVDLYANGRFIRREERHPYEWGRRNRDSDPMLRNLQPGVINLRAVIVGDCGEENEITARVYVTSQ